jgi:hypothetical protein
MSMTRSSSTIFYLERTSYLVTIATSQLFSCSCTTSIRRRKDKEDSFCNCGSKFCTILAMATLPLRFRVVGME